MAAWRFAPHNHADQADIGRQSLRLFRPRGLSAAPLAYFTIHQPPKGETMSENSATTETPSVLQVNGLADASYYEALYQIIQDAQAAGSVIQIVTIWPTTLGDEGGGGVVKPMDCQPSGACPK